MLITLITFVYFNRMDEMAIRVEREPKPINSMWKNVDHIDTGFQLKNKIYFFKGNNFYEFDEKQRTIHLEQPKSAVEYWMHCPPIRGNKVTSTTTRHRVPSTTPKVKVSSAITVQCSILFILTLSILIQMF